MENTFEVKNSVKTKLYTEDEVIEMVLDAHRNITDRALEEDAPDAGTHFMLMGLVVAAEVKKIMDKKKGVE